MKSKILIVSLILPVSLLLADQSQTHAFAKKPPRIACGDSPAQLLKKRAPYVKIADTYIFAGYRQVSAKNQDPVILRFDGGKRTWCRKDYETNNDDGRAYALFYDGTRLYAAFSATGTQGKASRDFRRFTQQGWMKSYGRGGGAKSAVILKLNPDTGEGISGTFVNAVLKNGKSNSLVVNHMNLSDGALVVQADSWYSPRRPDRQALSCSGKSPFAVRLQFEQDLSALRSVEADGCN